MKEKLFTLNQWGMDNKCKIIGISMFGKYFENKNCDVVNLFKETNIITNWIKRLDSKLHFMSKDYWLNENLLIKCKNNCDTVIIFDFFNTNYSLFQSVLGETKAKRKIIYLWNSIEKPLNDIPDDWEIWTFDLGNAKQYKYKYGGTFYPIEEYSSDIDYEQTKYDIYFAGLDKGRRTKIEEIEKELNNYSIKYKVELMSRKINQLLFDRYIMYKPYKHILKCIKASKAILDITKDEQKGLTLRVIESLCFKKKLITNNSCITKYRFYNPNNIFILGMDDMSNLSSFLNVPYSSVNFDIKEYDISRWLDRILNDEQFFYEQNNL